MALNKPSGSKILAMPETTVSFGIALGKIAVLNECLNVLKFLKKKVSMRNTQSSEELPKQDHYWKRIS